MVNSMKRKYFGTDGVRGRVGTHPMTPDFALRLGYAAGKTLLAHAADHAGRDSRSDRPAVLIGKDTRISGYMIESALESGLAAAGADVQLCGPMPTAAIAYLTRALRLAAGVVISASHNPHDDNGIKFFSAGGLKLPDGIEAEIESRLEEPLVCVDSSRLGKVRRVEDAAGRYIEFCKSTFPYERHLRGLKIVLDCAHGAAYHIAPLVFHELGAQVITLGVQPDGCNINRDCGATAPQAMQNKVKAQGADLGIALDGDADRVLMCDGAGRLFDGDALLYVIVRGRLMQAGAHSPKHRPLPFGGVVGTLMTNFGFEQAMQRLEVPFVRAQVGDRYVLEQLQARGWQLGGENSGHILCLDRHSTGDGIISALQVLAALRARDETLEEACQDLHLVAQTLINVRLPQNFDWAHDAQLQAAVQDVQQALDGRGRVLLRPSGTEPLLRVMVEGEDENEVSAYAQAIAHALAP
jgi:phosphoglucosamine mutase